MLTEIAAKWQIRLCGETLEAALFHLHCLCENTWEFQISVRTRATATFSITDTYRTCEILKVVSLTDEQTEGRYRPHD